MCVCVCEREREREREGEDGDVSQSVSVCYKQGSVKAEGHDQRSSLILRHRMWSVLWCFLTSYKLEIY